MADPVDPIRVAPPLPSADQSATSAYRRQLRALEAVREVLADRYRLEADVLAQLRDRLQRLQRDLQAHLLGRVTNFRLAQTRALLASVDALLSDTVMAISTDARQAFARAATLGETMPDQALRGAQVMVMPTAPTLSHELVMAAYENTLDLLSPAMQTFRTEIALGVRRIALAGENRFEEIQRLQRTLEAQGFDHAQYRAERIVRTELGRTFSQAAYDRFVQLSAQAPYLRKGWRATNDTRTRQGHREAGARYGRGRGIPVADRFTLTHYDHKGAPAGTVDLRFPLDPEAIPAGKLAAANTIMCRCSAFVEFDPAEFGSRARDRIAHALRDARPSTRPVPA